MKSMTLRPDGEMRNALMRIECGQPSLDDMAMASDFDLRDGQRLSLLGVVVMSELIRGWRVVLPMPVMKGAE